MISRTIAILIASTSLGSTAWACSCLPFTVESSWFNNTDTLVVDIEGKKETGFTHYYAARVRKAFAGCGERGDQLVLVTPSSEATCGTSFIIGQTYLVFGNHSGFYQGLPTLDVDLCDSNKLASTVTQAERDYLLSRQIDCPYNGSTTCADNSVPVQCPVDPCLNAPSCGNTTCVSNTCGDCTWEQYDQFGLLACEGP